MSDNKRMIGERIRMHAGTIAVAIAVMVAATLWLTPLPAADKDQEDQKKAPLPRLVDVGADKCIPCIMMAPVLEELKKEYAGVLDVRFVDVWKNPGEGKKYNIRGIPTQIFYNASGKELARHMGFISKEDILKKFEELKVPLKKTGSTK